MIINNLPAGFSKQIILDWFSDCSNYTSSIFSKDLTVQLLNSLTLKFSDEIVSSDYGFSKKDALEEFIDSYPELPDEIKEKINNLPDPECLYQYAETVADIHGIDIEDVRGEINNIVHKVTHGRDGGLKAGSYNHPTRTITIYDSVIRSGANNGNYIDYFKQVFAHEFFHAYHCFYARNFGQNNDIEMLKRHDWTSIVVKESLASYFESIIVLYFRLDSPTDFDYEWRWNDVCVYPYAGAISLLNNTNRLQRVIDQGVINIFNVSINSLDSALKLMYINDIITLCRIKNVVIYKNVFVKQTKPLIISKKSTVLKKLLEKSRVVEIAKKYLRWIIQNLLNATDINSLKDKNYSKNIFNMNYPVLSTSMIITNGKKRYYVESISINGEALYLCSQWYDRNKEKLKKWILDVLSK